MRHERNPACVSGCGTEQVPKPEQPTPLLLFYLVVIFSPPANQERRIPVDCQNTRDCE
jgi:hypothetical protein